MKGGEHVGHLNPDDLVKARQFFEEAIALDPEYPDPYIGIGFIHWQEARLGMSKSPQKSMREAFELAQKALALDESHPRARSLLGVIYLRMRQYEKGIAACERAVALNPNDIGALCSLGLALSAADRPQEAIPFLEKAIRLNPIDPMPAIFFLGDTYRVMEQYEKAIPLLKKALNYTPKSYMILLVLASCYGALEREEEARATVTALLKLNPDFSLDRFAEQMLHRGAAKERFLENCRKAGLK